MADRKAQGSEVAFFCRACLTDKPLNEQSYDPRFCNFCYDILLAEVPETHGSKGGGPWWLPKRRPPDDNHTPHEPQAVLSPIRGRRQLPLPVDFIRSLEAAEGLGGKAIATRLFDERGISISYKTIQRILAGKRIQRQPPLPI